MPKQFEILVFYPDGATPETAQNKPSALSQKWSEVCANILAEQGPVFKRNMGSTLSHFDVEMAGPMGRLIVSGIVCFDFWISLGRGTEQDKASISHFREFLSNACKTCGRSTTQDALAALQDLQAKPTFIMFDFCNPKIEDQQKAAIAQLGLHLADAYFEYCENGQQSGCT